MKASDLTITVTLDTKTYFAERRARLTASALEHLTAQGGQTATQLRIALDCGMRELDSILQELRIAGQIHSVRRRWELNA